MLEPHPAQPPGRQGGVDSSAGLPSAWSRALGTSQSPLPPALTEASGLDHVYMMHSSKEHQAPGRRPGTSSRKARGRGPEVRWGTWDATIPGEEATGYLPTT